MASYVIADALDKVASLKELDLQIMGNKSREIAKRLFDNNTIEKQWLEIIETPVPL